MAGKVNHRCIICGEGYYHCNDCGNMKSFTPWRSVACSAECYQAYLAYLEYRDQTKDAKLFAEQVEQIGMKPSKLPPSLMKVYRTGRASVKKAPVEEVVGAEAQPLPVIKTADIVTAELKEESFEEACEQASPS